MSDNTHIEPNPPGGDQFATTHWSVVLAAGQPGSSRHHQALETLCRTYWFPLYAYLRRQGHNAHQAEDHAQAFFAYLLEKESVRSANPQRGRFRSFLLATLKHFLSDERDRDRAQKRGGGRKVLSLGFEDAETRYALEPGHELTAEKTFEKAWALTVLNRTMTRLKAELAGAEKQKFFEHLKAYLTAESGSVPYRYAAAELGMTEGAVKVAVHRLRSRYRRLLREEIAQTVATEEMIEQEIRDLFNALAS
ncbi:MAG: RNA polymerase sigma factor [Planctomycetota bacterium]|jgi:RNA polymerase sigma-70 factor (ECF subfamily)